METDILAVGCGPAGLQAAIHAARRKATVLVTGKLSRSALAKAHVENMCGIPGRVDGMAILETGRKQAESFGSRFNDSDVVHLEKAENRFKAGLEDGSEIWARALVFALGTKRSGLKVPGAEDYVGKGLSYCADCDAMFFRNKTVVVVGDESAAASSALMLCDYAKTTYLLSKELRTTAKMRAKLLASGVQFLEGKGMTGITGDPVVEGITLDDGTSVKTDGVFVELGAKGSIELGALIDLFPEADGHILVDRKMATAVPGVFACGDITGPPFQATKAAGEGCIAGLSAASYIEALKIAAHEPGPREKSDSWEKTSKNPDH
jgi:thioredoxin reductase (NADPH)